MTDAGRRPVIGITTYVEPAGWGDWVATPAALVPYTYVRHAERAGGLVVLVPPRSGADADEALAEEILGRLDGLVLAGGVDVEPARYGQAPHPAVQHARPERDDLELTLARVSAQRCTPVLGICRGMQVMAVAGGGSLEQHLPDLESVVAHSDSPGVYARHHVSVAEGSRLGDILGREADVPSYHHQGVLTHPGYVASAWAADGLVEGIEDPDQPFRVAVQWHPEVDDDPRLFEALVRAAAASSETRHD